MSIIKELYKWKDTNQMQAIKIIKEFMSCSLDTSILIEINLPTNINELQRGQNFETEEIQSLGTMGSQKVGYVRSLYCRSVATRVDL